MEPSLPLIADTLLILGTLAAAFYCRILSRRVRALRRLDSGLGGAIATFSKQVEDMQASLKDAREISGGENTRLLELTARAEVAAGRLELLLAAIHDKDGATPIRRTKPPQPPGSEPQTESQAEALQGALDELATLAHRLGRSGAMR